MKKIYFLVFSVLTLGSMQAQSSYTLTQANSEPVINDTYDLKGIDTTNALPMTTSGQNVTWNVTGIAESGVLSTVNCIDPSGDANSGNYPGTTMVQVETNTTSYFKSTTNKFELLGLDGGQFILNYNANAATVAQYPITYGYVNNDLGAGAITAGSLTGTFNSTISTVADGTGTLSLNGVASFGNCIRLKTTQHIDFVLGNPPFTTNGTMDQVIYNYYNSSSKFPLFQAVYIHVVVPIASIDQHQDQVSMLSSIVLGLHDQNDRNSIFKAYPNPADKNVNLHFVLTQNESYTVEISNAIGQVVKTIKMNDLQPGMYNETIDLTGLNAGVYSINVIGKSSKGTEKLIIQ